jgi:uncharacterized protein (DUF952 family)
MVKYASASESRDAKVTYHLVPHAYWQSTAEQETYTPEAFATDGFIHCTNGTDELLQVANRYYTGDPREFLALALDVTRIAADVRYDDDSTIYPHIYGPLNTDAVIGSMPVHRSPDGSFVGLGPVEPVAVDQG